MYSAGMPIALAAVAPHGGAWIEIRRKRKPAHTNQSPLTEGRGLKCGGRRAHPIACQSPLTEGRGLKYARYWETISRLSRPSRRGVD